MSDSGDDWSSLAPEADGSSECSDSPPRSVDSAASTVDAAPSGHRRVAPASRARRPRPPAHSSRAARSTPVSPPQPIPAYACAPIRSHASITSPWVAPRPCPVCNSIRSPPHMTSVVGGTTHVLLSKSGYEEHYHLPAEDYRGPFYIITRGRAVGVFENPCIVAGLTSSVPGGCHTKHKSREGAIQAWSTALSVGLVEMVN